MISLDLGCGYIPNLHEPIIDSTISIDINLHKAPWVSVLRNPIIASAEAIPIKSNSIHKAYLKAILEHLPHPWIALEEVKRIARRNAQIIITLPIVASHQKYWLKILFTHFPFSLIKIIKALWRHRKHESEEGWNHRYEIIPHLISHYFSIKRVQQHYHRHTWFQYPPFRNLFKWRNVPRDIQGEWWIWAVNGES